MSLKRNDFCPLIKEPCKQLDCNFFVQLRGKGPDGIDLDEWACAFLWLPPLLIENSKEVRQGAAATESFRNVMLELNKGTPVEVIETKAQMKALEDVNL